MFQLLQIIISASLVINSAGYCTTPRTSKCSNGFQISDWKRDYPFWIEDEKYNCRGDPEFRIKCSQSGRPLIDISNHLYYIQNIDFSDRTLTVMDKDVEGQTCPQPRRNFSLESSPFLDYDYNRDRNLTIFYNCTSYPENVFEHLPCLQTLVSYNNNNTKRSFAFLDNIIPEGFDWYNNCEEIVVVPVLQNASLDSNYKASLEMGFGLRWTTPLDCEVCRRSGGHCLSNKTTSAFRCLCADGSIMPFDSICPKLRNHGWSGVPSRLKAIIAASTGVGGLLLILLIIYRRIFLTFCYFIISPPRNTFKSPRNVEAFLASCGCLSLQRYKYSEIKKITNSFKETLGKGGYGCVFKGRLRDGRLVAIKVLHSSKGIGEEFINEVATIGRTNHINVVNLLGFCIEGTKRALVYEFMPNGSLEKFIYNEEKNMSSISPPLGWEKLYRISLGIARGLEYLHRGCNTRILHFDIKPHNILLDKDFCPKISDFGMAKLCETSKSVVSMIGPRGTLGYIAPEVYSRNFGGVSHKSDVYSYGMMLLEMIGGRKKIDATVENISEIYFPDWIYGRLKQDNKLKGSDEANIRRTNEIFEDDTPKKMIIVALWCIQAHPSDRPSMKKVAEMLEGNISVLDMPPNPSIYPRPNSSTSSS